MADEKKISADIVNEDQLDDVSGGANQNENNNTGMKAGINVFPTTWTPIDMKAGINVFPTTWTPIED